MHATAEMVLVVGRRGMVVPVQLGAQSSCICITATYNHHADDSAAFLELESELTNQNFLESEDWYNR